MERGWMGMDRSGMVTPVLRSRAPGQAFIQLTGTSYATHGGPTHHGTVLTMALLTMPATPPRPSRAPWRTGDSVQQAERR